MEAPSRDKAFALLRSQGIRPIKVVAADGSKENGAAVSGRFSRWVLLALLVGLAALAVLVVLVRQSPDASNLLNQTRRYPIGDAAIIEKGVITGWSNVFDHEGERFFASFAVPGVRAGQRNTTVEELEAALARRVEAKAEDTIEARQIIAMVEGMKAEARAYIAAGGSILEYGKRLTERQDAEIAVYERAKSEMEYARKSLPELALIDFLEERNEKLRNLGIRPITLESLEVRREEP